MKPYEIVARRAEDYSKRLWDGDVFLQPTQKDGALSLILDLISWLDRMPGSKEVKAPYLKRMWNAYLNCQEGKANDTKMVAQLISGDRRVTYSEDQEVETSISDSGIGTGGLGYASVRSQDIGTAYRGKQADPYFRKVAKSPCRTLEGEEKAQAYANYLKNKE